MSSSRPLAPLPALRLALAVAVALVAAHPAAAATLTFSTPISGDTVPVTVELLGALGGDRVEVSVSIPAGEGDLLGLFGNVVDESLVPGMAVDDPSGVVTQYQFQDDAVWKVGGGNTMSPVKMWDWGLKLGTTGGGGAVTTASFALTGPGLTVDELLAGLNQGWVLGVRIQDTLGVEGSAKIGLSADAPRIRVLVPSGGTLLAATPTPVSGTVLGTGVTVDVNGASAGVAGGVFDVDVSLAEGPNTLLATAANGLGTATDAVDVVLDTTPPVVTITDPPDGTLTASPDALVQGTVTDASPIAAFTLNGQAVTLADDTFQTTLSLALGDNPITAEATDAAGHTGSDSIMVVRGEPPSVAITSPLDGALLAPGTVTVSGTATGVPAPGVVVNGVVATVSAGTFVADVPVSEGANTLTATATNALGSDSAQVLVTAGVPPTVQIASPAAGLLTNQNPLTVTGSLTGTTPVAVTVNGVAATVSGATFSASVPLVEGANPLEATAANPFGSASTSVDVTLDTTPPVVTIASPADGATLDASPVAISGSVADASPILSLSLDGAPLAPGNAFATSAPLVEGTNTFTVQAADAAGNTGSASVTVSFSSVDLAVAITSPPDGSLVSRPRVTVSGTVSVPTARVAVSGVPATVTGSQWVASGVPLVEGANDLVVQATEGSSSAEDAVTVTFNAPPEISITAPRDGATLRVGATDVLGFVDDPLAMVDVNGVQADVDSAGRFVAPAVPLDTGPNDLIARAIDLAGAQASAAAIVTRDDGAAPTLRIYAATAFNFDDAAFTSDYPVVFFSNDEEYFVGYRRIGRTKAALDPPVAQATAKDFGVFVLSEEADPVALDFAFDDGSPTDEYRVVFKGSGPIEELDTWLPLEIGELFQFPLLQVFGPAVNREVLDPQDFEARYYHHFVVERFVFSVADSDISGDPVFREGFVTLSATQAAASDALRLFWDEVPPTGEITSPTWNSVVQGPAVTLTGPLDEGRSVAAVQYEVRTFPPNFLPMETTFGEVTSVDDRFLITTPPLTTPAAHNIRVYPFDLANRTAEELLVPVDTDPAALDVALAFPREGSAVTADSVSLSFRFGVPLTLVSLNGVPDGRSFLAGTALDVASMDLVPGENVVELVVDDGTGQRGFTFTIYRVAEIAAPRITSPTDGEVVATDPIVVEGTVPLGTPLVEVNGVPATILDDGIRFRAEMPVPGLGIELRGGDVVTKPLPITAVAHPTGESDRIEVVPDLRPPSFHVVLPEDGSATTASEVGFGGWVDEAARLELVVGGETLVARTTRDRERERLHERNVLFTNVQFHRFELPPVALAQGTNSVTLTATDAAGNATTRTLDVERVGDALALASPTAPVPDLSTDLVFDVLEAVEVDAMFVRGMFITSSRAVPLGAGQATFTGIPLEPGPNDVRVVYHRPGGPVQTLRFDVTSTSTDASVLTGTVTDSRTGEGIWGALVSLDVGGQTLLVATDPGGSFRVLVEPGQVTGTVTAEGFAGGSLDFTLAGGETVVADTALDPTGVPALANEVEILVPPDGTVTDWDTVTVVGDVLNPASTVSVNGIAAQVVGHRFTARGVPLAMGANTIQATASAVGLPDATANVAVERSDTPVLDVTIYSPPEGATAPGNGLVVRGFVSARQARTVVGRSLAPVVDGVFAVPDVLVGAGSGRVAAVSDPGDGSSSVSDIVAISLQTAERALGLGADPESGPVPLDAELRLTASVPVDIARIDFDLDGDLEPEIVDDADGVVASRRTTPGFAVARALVTTSSGVELTAGVRLGAHLPAVVSRSFAAGNPVDLAPAPGGDVYVLDRAAATITRYRLDGSIVAAFGSSGAGPDQLAAPEGMAFAPDGLVYVADTGNDRIQVFDPLGVHVRQIGGPATLRGPRGVAVDGDVVAVSDGGNDRVQLYTTNGAVLASVPVAEPRGLTVQAGHGFLVASPVEGLRAIVAESAGSVRLETPKALRFPENAQALGSPVDVGPGGPGLAVADASRGRVVFLSGGLDLERRLEIPFDPGPRAVLDARRRALPSLLVADGTRVLEIGLPVPSPIPVVEDLKSRLAAGDVQGALQLIEPVQRDLFEEIYTGLGPDLATQAALLGPTRIDLLSERAAIVRVEVPIRTAAGTAVRELPIYLIRDEDGSWLVFDY